MLAWPAAAAARASATFSMVGVSWRSPGQVRIELRVRLGRGPLEPVGAGLGGWARRRWAAGGASESRCGSAAPTRFSCAARTPRPGCGCTPSRPSPRPRSRRRRRRARVGAAGPVAARRSRPAADHRPLGVGRPRRSVRWSGPFYGSVQLAFVHHTDNPNGYSRERGAGDAAGDVSTTTGTCAASTTSPTTSSSTPSAASGRRAAGGIDEPVIGAHAGGYNRVSTGVAVLGTFIGRVPTTAGARRARAAAGVEALAARRADAWAAFGCEVEPRRRLLYAVSARPARAPARASPATATAISPTARAMPSTSGCRRCVRG